MGDVKHTASPNLLLVWIRNLLKFRIIHCPFLRDLKTQVTEAACDRKIEQKLSQHIYEACGQLPAKAKSQAQNETQTVIFDLTNTHV